MIDLSASMNPFAPDVAPIVADIVTRTDSTALAAYPDPSDATNELADAIGVDRRRLVLTNGGAEAIALVAAELGTGNVVQPEFGLYARHLARLDDTAPRWRSNPSNPIGRLAGDADVAGVWDEAFHPLATGRWTRGDDVAWRLGSLTKLWSCPGLRLGFVIAPDEALAHAVRRRQPQWSVNGIALSLVREMLALTDLLGWQRRIAELRGELLEALTALGFTVTDTDVNWLLVDRPGLRAEIAPHGVFVRDCTSFGLPGIHRIGLPRPDQVERVLAAFAAVAAGR